MRKYSRVEDRKILEEAWDWHTKFMLKVCRVA